MLPWRNCKKHYFSVDRILATQEKVPCTFLKNVPETGCLDPSSENGEILKNSKVEIPFWLAKVLANSEFSVVQVEVPKIYKDVCRDILNADASVVDLYKMSKFFYTFGKLISDIDRRESKELQSLLIQTFKERFRQLLDWVQNIGADEIITEKLDFLERQILIDGRAVQIKLNNWLSHGVGLVQPADMVVNHKKRKLVALEGF
ncbi:DNA replication complex GINS protein Psf3 [Lycorma delicatula]|uniref:DNA replication complex GINS protein Psf3 n=1 Tax=Lycorma delicatula TaxID=130591 RepID=UPI003F519874